MTRSIFVTGATGFIGGHLVRRLLARGDRVTALVRAPGRLPPEVRAVVGELIRPETYEEALIGCDAVVHLAADYRLGPVDRNAMFATNVLGTRALLDVAGSARFVHVSSTAALGDTGGRELDEHHRHDGVFRSYYEETKHIAHGIVEDRIVHGAPAVVAIPGGVFGEGDRSVLARTLADFRAGRLPFQVATTSRFNLCHVDAVTDGLVRVLDHSRIGEQWILTGANVSMPELLAEVGTIIGKKPPRALPPRVLSGPARVLDLIARTTGAALPLSREALALMDGSTYTYSSAKARTSLGWDPGDFHAALAAYLA